MEAVTFFDTLFTQTADLTPYFLTIRVANRLLRLEFGSEADRERMRGYCSYSVVESHETPNAVLRFWHDDPAKYLQKQMDEEEVLLFDGAVSVQFHGNFFCAYDYSRHLGYQCMGDLPGWLLDGVGTGAQLFSRWALDEGLAMVHGACIGVDGEGVLVSAATGSGKSTCAAGNLLAGGQYVADDYVLLERENGRVKAYTLLSFLCLTQESMARMPELDVKVLEIRPTKNGKRRLDISAYYHQFYQGLPVNALMLPKLGMVDCVGFTPQRPGTGVPLLILSTLVQLHQRGSASQAGTIAKHLAGLPTYEMVLSPDPVRNAKDIHNFIKNIK